MISPATQFALVAVALISTGVAGGVAFSGANVLPKVSADYVSIPQGPNDYKPNECNGIVVTAVVVNADGGGASELILGTSGADTLNGGGGTDCMVGGGGVDELRGDAGNDVLLGGPGDDRVRGGDDNDALYGGTGTDECRGENGTDTFPGGDCENIQQ